MQQRFTAAWEWFVAFVESLAASVIALATAHRTIDQARQIDVQSGFDHDRGSAAGCGASGCNALIAQITGTAFGYGVYVFAGLLGVFAFFSLIRFTKSVRREP